MTEQTAYTRWLDRAVASAESFPRSASGGGVQMGLRQIFSLVLRRKGLAVLIVAGSVGLATVSSVFLMPRYTGKVLLSVGEGENGPADRRNEDAIDTHLVQLGSHAHLAQVLAALRKTPAYHDRYAGVSDLERRLKVMQESRSRLISVNFTAKSPEEAADVANLTAQLYVDKILSADDASGKAIERQKERVEDLEKTVRDLRARIEKPGVGPTGAQDAREDASRLAELEDTLEKESTRLSLMQSQVENRKQSLLLSPPIQIYATADKPELPSTTRPAFIILPAFLASTLFAIGLSVLLGRLDRKIRSTDDLRNAFGLPVICDAPSRGAPSEFAADPSYERELQNAALKLFLSTSPGNKQVVLVIAAGDAEGPTFAADLAEAASQIRPVLVLSADAALTMHSADPDPGLKERPQIAFRSLAQSPQHLLAMAGSGPLAATLTRHRQHHDLIIIAAPPATVSPAGRILASMVDAIIVPVELESVNYDDVAELMRDLGQEGGLWNEGAPRRRVAFAAVRP
ncbi:capsular polysaccharide biosynthesis protein [Rhodoblastus acidophilus]|uniref:hypothetical protein n=1 Tax=Rhodoblastus acidophilus TaxID=1074 RepID=UPI002224EFC1|nr:hypothetical protein [Rhodoblastus acidophilus]MCW2285388.1 capsular polysaccharide biosynthesis protein [Rhodoblastus acidophilus]MCW2334364.1 capsular polysaccharide biosynthesis protein [Rhodoblastus acidophilus]